MINKITNHPLYMILVLIAFAAVSCKKDNDTSPMTTIPAPLVTLGLYQYNQDVYKRLFIPISAIGNSSATTYFGIFDTGSTGMTIDAEGLIPAGMISANGIAFTGDSINVNGITITNKQSVMAYGDAISSTREFGYLAYASVVIGTGNSRITTKRIPFFLYYKVVDGNGNQLAAHSSDVFGVGPGVSYASNLIASPLSYFTYANGVTNGFKLARLSAANFTTTGQYVADLLTVGLLADDLAATSGFVMHPLNYSNTGGYSANIASTITYAGKSISGQVLFDSGTPAITVIKDITANAIGSLPSNTLVSLTTFKGFKYTYTTTNTGNLTEIQNPNNSGDYRTIFSLSFFIDNEYLTDYANHQIGLKNHYDAI
jgi:hypothetical protein